MTLGKVEDILATGSNDVYVVKNGKKEYLIPAIADVVKRIDLERKTILIEVMQGLLD
jgi:16S rRNA processing protein RimM